MGGRGIYTGNHSLELKLWATVLGTKIGSFRREVGTLNCLANSPASHYSFEYEIIYHALT